MKYAIEIENLTKSFKGIKMVITVAGSLSNILLLNWEKSFLSPWAIPADIAFITTKQAAEDLAQEVFIKLYDNPPRHANVAAWLFKVANNLAYNYLRDEKVRKNKEPVVSAGEEDKVISIEDAAIRNQEIRTIKKVLSLLPERDRMCLLLKFSGYKYNEIAEIIGVEKTSVGTILARSQAKFMDKFLKEG